VEEPLFKIASEKIEFIQEKCRHLDMNDLFSEDQMNIVYTYKDLVAAFLESSSGVSFPIFIHCEYGYKLHD
jgi:hypothetical protein